MRGVFFGSAVTVAVIALSGCATTEQSPQEQGLTPLTQSKLEAHFSGTRSIRWTNAKGYTGSSTFRNDGVVQIDWDTGINEPGSWGSDEGSWRIKEGRLCTKYNELRGGVEQCFTIYETGDNEYKYFYPDGSYNATVSFTN